MKNIKKSCFFKQLNKRVLKVFSNVNRRGQRKKNKGEKNNNERHVKVFRYRIR
jgi:hypothetical protein